MRNLALIVGALLAGFAGGALSSNVAHLHKPEITESVIRARRFELVDGTGRVISYWGKDKRNFVVLVFGSNFAEGGPSGGPLPGGLDVPENQRAPLCQDQ